MARVEPVVPESASLLTRRQRTSALQRMRRVAAMRAGLVLRTLLSNVRLSHGMERPWKERYERLRRDFEHGDRLFQPSRQWTIIGMLYRLMLRGNGFSRFKATMGRFYAAYEPNNPIWFDALHHVYRLALGYRDDWGLLDALEEPALGGGDVVLVDGKPVSLDFLQSIEEFYSVREALGFDKDASVVLCEIGAGYGRLAHVTLSALPNATYVVVDLPESLIVSQYYLKSLYPRAKVALYPESAEVLASGTLASHRLVFLLPDQMRLLPRGSVDGVLNVYSFMEMRREQVERYFDLIENLDVRALYLKQHKEEANLLDRNVIGETNYPVRPTWRRILSRTSMLYEHVFEAAYAVRR